MWLFCGVLQQVMATVRVRKALFAEILDGLGSFAGDTDDDAAVAYPFPQGDMVVGPPERFRQSRRAFCPKMGGNYLSQFHSGPPANHRRAAARIQRIDVVHCGTSFNGRYDDDPTEDSCPGMSSLVSLPAITPTS